MTFIASHVEAAFPHVPVYDLHYLWPILDCELTVSQVTALGRTELIRLCDEQCLLTTAEPVWRVEIGVIRGETPGTCSTLHVDVRVLAFGDEPAGISR